MAENLAEAIREVVENTTKRITLSEFTTYAESNQWLRVSSRIAPDLSEVNQETWLTPAGNRVSIICRNAGSVEVM